jgi:hypothetical protein
MQAQGKQGALYVWPGVCWVGVRMRWCKRMVGGRLEASWRQVGGGVSTGMSERASALHAHKQ